MNHESSAPSGLSRAEVDTSHVGITWMTWRSSPPRTGAYPIEEVNDHPRASPGRADAVGRSLGGAAEPYRLTHEGATNQYRLDSWMAGRLGAEPRPPLRSRG